MPPRLGEAIGLRQLTPDSIADAWFADRLTHDPFQWAQRNLQEVERNSANTTVLALCHSAPA